MPPELEQTDNNETIAPVPETTAETPATDKSAEEPKTLLDAINSAVPGVDAEKPAAEVKPEVKSETTDTPAGEEIDPTKMPEGLTPKAQERFQKLATMNKELTGKVEEITSVVEPFRVALQENGVRKEQFDQAANVIGMMNKGDFEGALKVLDEQRRLISLAIGKSLPGVDALSDFPDLREQVDQMQITEEFALEIAGSRAQKLRQQHQMEQRQQVEQTSQAQTTAIHAGLKEVDDFTRQMMKTDIDFAAIEKQLLPRIPKLLEGIPPNMWQKKVMELYHLIKEAGAHNRQTTTTQTLRPTGTPSPSSAPKNMFDAMFPST